MNLITSYVIPQALACGWDSPEDFSHLPPRLAARARIQIKTNEGYKESILQYVKDNPGVSHTGITFNVKHGTSKIFQQMLHELVRDGYIIRWSEPVARTRKSCHRLATIEERQKVLKSIPKEPRY